MPSHVHSRDDGRYHADLVRLIHGDTNPLGPGYKEQRVEDPIDRDYEGREQHIHAGSWMLVPCHPMLRALTSLTLQAFVWPTVPGAGTQAVAAVSTSDGEDALSLILNADGLLELRAGGETLTGDRPLLPKVWYLVAGGYDSESGRMMLYQRAAVTATNGGLGPNLIQADDLKPVLREAKANGRLCPSGPLLVGALAGGGESGKRLDGPMYGDQPLALPRVAAHFNGKISRPAHARALPAR